jgi:hypothetical protein
MGILEKMVSGTARFLHIGPSLSAFLRFLIRDEMIAIGRKTGEALR